MVQAQAGEGAGEGVAYPEADGVEGDIGGHDEAATQEADVP